jgi:S-adenosylmethionine:tRNA ribosyltransferase-isomerase
MYSIYDYDYHLPEALIAQHPVDQRDRSRLLVLDRRTGEVAHRIFADLVDLLTADDVLVVNNTAVIPGRIHGRKPSGGKVEILVLDYAGGVGENGNFTVACLVKASKPPRPGSELIVSPDVTATVLGGRGGCYDLKFHLPAGQTFDALLQRCGAVPLPPYIHRETDETAGSDRNRYQTIYARDKGAVAAPTAGLHFTSSLLEALQAKGIDVVPITLHVGYGTFIPVRVDDIRRHEMHTERFVIPEASALRINRAVENGKRVIAVGTTCVRTLEFFTDRNGMLQSGGGQCDLFIYPGYRFRMVGGLITNFHLPRSTLLMLVSAFAGRENIMAAYRQAIDRQYRFYSYGDAMLIR